MVGLDLEMCAVDHVVQGGQENMLDGRQEDSSIWCKVEHEGDRRFDR